MPRTHDENRERDHDQRLDVALDLLTASLVLAQSVVEGEPDRELAAELIQRIKAMPFSC